MRYNLRSHLKQYIQGMQEQKRALGYHYVDGEGILGRFDDFCASHYPHEQTITKEVGLDWATLRTDESGKNLSSRLGPIRELARYMIREGVDAYIIPPGIGAAPETRQPPHIFTELELRSVFAEVDKLSPSKRDFTRHLVAPVLLRLLYCCGLRPSEGSQLKRENIDLSRGVIKIPDSKGHKDRMVVVSESMKLLCQRYDAVMKRLVPTSVYFFPSIRLPAFDRHTVADILRQCWRQAGFDDADCPRPYDFRHTYATKILYKWLDAGRDLDNCLPYLSAYMGHARFAHTAYYIHLVPEFFPQMAKMDINKFAQAIPEVEV
jgi:integrase